MIAATKVNWWQCNHHLGQEGMQGYAHKTFRIKYPGQQPNACTTVVHTAGHWASTKLVLRQLGWQGIQAVEPVVRRTDFKCSRTVQQRKTLASRLSMTTSWL